MGEKMEKRFTWVLKQFSSLQEICHSRTFAAAGCNWCLVAYPKGYINGGYLSVYLNLVDPASLPSGWRREVKFGLTLVNKGLGKSNISFEWKCCFDAQHKGWGNGKIVPLTKLHDKGEGFLMNNRLVIVAEVQVFPAVVLPEETVKIIDPPRSKQGSDEDGSDEGTDEDSSFEEDGDNVDASSAVSDDGGEDTSSFSQSIALEDASHRVGDHGIKTKSVTAESEDSNDDAPKEDVEDELSSHVSNDSARNETSLDQVNSLEDSSQTVENGGRGFNTVSSITETANTLLTEKVQPAKDTVDINGFDVFSSQEKSVSHIFRRHPDIALNVRRKNRQIRSAYMNELLSLIELLCQSPEKLSEDDLSNADDTLADLIDVGFNLDWLKTKLNEVNAKKKKEQNSEARLRTIEEQLQKMKLMFLDLETQLQMKKAEALAARAPLSFDDVVCSPSSKRHNSLAVSFDSTISSFLKAQGLEVCLGEIFITGNVQASWQEVHLGDKGLLFIKWYLYANPTEYNSTYLSLGLEVADFNSLPSGWRRYVKLRLSIVKQLSEEPAVLKETHLWFDHQDLWWEFSSTELNEEEGFLVNGELMIVAEVEVLEVIGTSDGSEECEGAYESRCEMKRDDGPKTCDLLNQTQHVKESIDVNGFQVLPSQVKSVRHIFERHPDIAAEFRAKNQHLRNACMNFLLSLIETVCQSLEELSNEDLVEADIALTYVKDAGFKVDWLERKLDQVKEKKEKEQSSLARLQEMEDSLLKLKQKCSDLDALVKKEEAELSTTRTPLSFDDVV